MEQAHTFLSVLVIAWSKHPILFFLDCISLPNFEVFEVIPVPSGLKH